MIDDFYHWLYWNTWITISLETHEPKNTRKCKMVKVVEVCCISQSTQISYHVALCCIHMQSKILVFFMNKLQNLMVKFQHSFKSDVHFVWHAETCTVRSCCWQTVARVGGDLMYQSIEVRHSIHVHAIQFNNPSRSTSQYTCHSV